MPPKANAKNLIDGQNVTECYMSRILLSVEFICVAIESRKEAIIWYHVGHADGQEVKLECNEWWRVLELVADSCNSIAEFSPCNIWYNNLFWSFVQFFSKFILWNVTKKKKIKNRKIKTKEKIVYDAFDYFCLRLRR